jgi:hypothetical protein
MNIALNESALGQPPLSPLEVFREASHQQAIGRMGDYIVQVVQHTPGDYRSAVVFSDEYRTILKGLAPTDLQR